MDKKERAKREKELRTRLGFSPQMAASSAMIGGATIAGGPVTALGSKATELMANGKPISAEAGTPIEALAEFQPSELRAIREFAASNKVTAPIVASGKKGFSAYGAGNSRLNELVAKLTGEELPASAPSIHLGDTSLPGAFHEIGHAKAILPDVPIAGATLSELRLLAQPGSPVGELLRIILGSQVLAPPDEHTSKARRFVYDNAPALVGATYLPHLAEEARATATAVQGARKYGPGAADALKELAPAFLSHTGPVVGAVFGTLLAKKLLEALHAKGEEKRADALHSTVNAAWRVGGTPPKPKTTPTGPSTKAKTQPPAAPPSKNAYYRDTLNSMQNPARGPRLAKPNA